MNENRDRLFSLHRGSGLLGDIVNKTHQLVDIPKNLAIAAVNKAIDLLPIEVHAPKYNFCGPGTKLEERLRRGNRGINLLYEACKDHDIAYHNYSDSSNRAKADRILADRAWERVKSSDASLVEKTVAWTVANIMKLKSRLGGKLRKRRLR